MPDEGPNTDKSAEEKEEKKPVLEEGKGKATDIQKARVETVEEVRDDIEEDLSGQKPEPSAEEAEGKESVEELETRLATEIEGNPLMHALFGGVEREEMLGTLKKQGYLFKFKLKLLPGKLKRLLKEAGKPKKDPKVENRELFQISTLVAYGITTSDKLSEFLGLLNQEIPRSEPKEGGAEEGEVLKEKDKKKRRPTKEEAVEAAGAQVVHEEGEEPPVSADVETGEVSGEEEPSDEAINKLFQELESSSPIFELVDMIWLFRVDPRLATKDEKAGYAKELRGLFGTDDIKLIREGIKQSGDKELLEFIQKKDLITDNEIDEKIALKHLVASMKGEKTPKAMQKAAEDLTRRMRLHIKREPSKPKGEGVEKEAPTSFLKAFGNTSVFRGLIRAIRLIKVGSEDTKGSEKEYQDAVKEVFGVDDIAVVRARLERGDENLRAFVSGDLLDEQGEVDRLQVSERVIEMLGGDRTKKRAFKVMRDLTSRLRRPEAVKKEPKKAAEPKPKAPKAKGAAKPVVEAKEELEVPAELLREAIEHILKQKHPEFPLGRIGRMILGDEQRKQVHNALQKLKVIGPEHEVDYERIKELLAKDIFEIPVVKVAGEAKEGFRDLGLLKEAMHAAGEAKGTIDALYFERQLGRSPEETAKIIEELKKLGVISSNEPYKVNKKKLESELAKLTAAKGAEAAPKTSELSERIRESIEVTAGKDKKKKKNLIFLWKVYSAGKEDRNNMLKEMLGIDNEDAVNLVFMHMDAAIEDLEKNNIDEAAVHLKGALKHAGLFEGAITAPDTGVVSVSTASAAAAASAATAAAEDKKRKKKKEKKAADEKEKDKEKKGAEEGKEKKEEEKVLSLTERSEKIEAFMANVGFPLDKKNPASVAIKDFLMTKISKEDDIKELEAFLDSVKYGDPIDAKYGQWGLEKLQKKITKNIPKMEALEAEIKMIQRQVNRTKSPLSIKESKKLRKELGTLYKKKTKLGNKLKELNIAFERATTKETADTTYARSPEQLLGMINIHFAKKTMEEEGKKGTPDYMKIMAETQDQIQKATEELSEEPGNVFWSRISPLSWFKPRLTSTLEAIVKGDDVLKKITPEKAAQLVKAWNTPGGVRNWIRSLEGSEQENMTTVVPAIIGHLAAAVNAGRWSSRLNTISVTRGRTLLKNMRDAVHQYSMASAEKTKGSSLEKMGAYFGQLNDVNKAASEINYKVVRNHAWWSMAKNVGMAAGVGAGGAGVYGLGVAGLAGYTALAGLSGLQLAGVGVAAASAGAGIGSFAVEDPEMKAFLRRTSFRLAAAGGLAALTIVPVPWTALPGMVSGAMAGISGTPWLTVGAAAGGFFLPEIWRNKRKVAVGAGAAAIGTAKAAPKVAKGGAKVAVGGAKVAAGTAYVGGRVGWAYTGAVASLLGLGLPLFSKKYRNFFGMHFRPLFEKKGRVLSQAPAPANDNVIPFKPKLARAA